MLRKFCCTPTQLTGNQSCCFFFPRKIQDALEDDEEIDLPPRMAFKELLPGGTFSALQGFITRQEDDIAATHLLCTLQALGTPRLGSRVSASSSRREQTSTALSRFLFILSLPHSPALGTNWFVGTREAAASVSCHILTPCQVFVARTDASVFNPECIWPLVFSMTQNKH